MHGRLGATEEKHQSLLPEAAAVAAAKSLQLCLTLCDSMDYSTPGFPALYHLPEFAQIHVL